MNWRVQRKPKISEKSRKLVFLAIQRKDMDTMMMMRAYVDDNDKSSDATYTIVLQYRYSTNTGLLLEKFVGPNAINQY